MLRRVYVDNFRCLTNFELRPEQVCTLVGPNGSGKSGLFEVLRCLQAFLSPNGVQVQQVFHPVSCTRWDGRREQRFEVEIESSGERFVYALVVHHSNDGKSSSIEERLTGNGEPLYVAAGAEVQLYGDKPVGSPRTTFPFDPQRSFLPVLEPRPDNRRITAFKNWVRDMWLFKLRPDLILGESRQEADALAIDGGNFVSWYRTLQQESPATIVDLTKALGPIIPGLASIKTMRVGQEARAMFLECQAEGTPFDLVLEELSEGQRVLLVLYAVAYAIAGKRASLLAFDEPDNFVSDAEIQPWLSLLRERMIDTKKGTLLVISHHPSVVDYLAADQVLYLWRSGGPTRLRALEVNRAAGETASSVLKFGPPIE